MKTYSHNYSKIAAAEMHLFAAQRLNDCDEPVEAWKHIEAARRNIQQYLSEDNMVVDDDVADGWVRMSDIEKLGLLT